MRISDWSSDVCSSDLRVQQAEASGAPKEIQEPRFCGVFCCPPVCYSHKKADIESALLFCGGEGGISLRARPLPRVRLPPSFQFCKAQKPTLSTLFCFVAEGGGFHPPVPFSVTLNRSAEARFGKECGVRLRF